MLFTTNLDAKIFSAHQYINCDELFIISGYVGPNPIQRLSNLPIRTTVIYGMFGSESISNRLHNTLVSLHNAPQNNILYSNIPVHSKCYIWRYNGNITYALIGSANFSTNGLNIPFRETLAETTSDTFLELNIYLNHILGNSVACNTVSIVPSIQTPTVTTRVNSSTNICSMVLFDPNTGEVPLSSGLNWGNSSAHTNPGDSYIPIRTAHIRNFPNLFPPKQTYPTNRSVGRPHRQNDSIELIWDDGTLMEALLEGSHPVNGGEYPKQLSSFPSKNTLGVYIRTRLGLTSTAIVTRADLDRYGRSDIEISLLQNGTYYVDFLV
ncbi:NgoFVII family restriction endonuclease [Peribacillus butanolivorans]|uniref:NgoFVII family restriction endonuclease n=1 Tax=Peribacillus butanolivorans TaxID=421767 RepID=A0AAX0S2B7_9BACI|nr:restriction endonuclease PLD domain-containing protein [Peribacillus butanolivorans]PEJ34202.1 NgoFVII family restriction endonuclease [Peribacillus butanolivorans]